jgi:transcriptional regulator with XRE-family HTH domain
VDFETVKLALGAEICEWRRLRNISQEKLAEESTLHVNEVGRVERGETNPELETLVLIATGMKMSLGVLFTAAEKRWWEEHGRGESGEGGSTQRLREIRHYNV